MIYPMIHLAVSLNWIILVSVHLKAHFIVNKLDIYEMFHINSAFDQCFACLIVVISWSITIISTRVASMGNAREENTSRDSHWEPIYNAMQF